MPELYICHKCGAAFPRTEQYFYRDSKMSDGFSSQCKSCQNPKRKVEPRVLAVTLPHTEEVSTIIANKKQTGIEWLTGAA